MKIGRLVWKFYREIYPPPTNCTAFLNILGNFKVSIFFFLSKIFITCGELPHMPHVKHTPVDEDEIFEKQVIHFLSEKSKESKYIKSLHTA